MSGDLAWLVPVWLTIVGASTPLLLAATGELVTEKAGVLNLGVEGMMLVGAIAGFAATAASGSHLLGLGAAAAGGMAMALVFAVLTLTFLANQVATGLALTIFGTGLSALLGAGFVGFALPPLPKLAVPALSEIPLLGAVLFQNDALVYLSILILGAVAWFLKKSRSGLILRAVGESHEAAHSLGYNVIGLRYAATLFGGAMCGLAGAFMSLSYTTMWAENMTAGRGWIALALVVFATWRPWRLLLGAYLFGGITILQLHAQGAGVALPSQLLSVLPYLATILVLVLISRDRARIRLNAPASLGKLFHPAA